MNSYPPETRKKVDADIESELEKVSGDQKAVLRSLFEAMHDADLSETGRLQTSIARFGVLLCSLSTQADRIQARMVRLTIAIVAMTAVLMVLTVVMLVKM